MKDDATGFVGNIPHHYDHDMGPMIFVDYAVDIAQRVAACSPVRVLETAAGAGIVARRFAPTAACWGKLDGDRPQSANARNRACEVSGRGGRRV